MKRCIPVIRKVDRISVGLQAAQIDAVLFQVLTYMPEDRMKIKLCGNLCFTHMSDFFLTKDPLRFRQAFLFLQQAALHGKGKGFYFYSGRSH